MEYEHIWALLQCVEVLFGSSDWYPHQRNTDPQYWRKVCKSTHLNPKTCKLAICGPSTFDLNVQPFHEHESYAAKIFWNIYCIERYDSWKAMQNVKENWLCGRLTLTTPPPPFYSNVNQIFKFGVWQKILKDLWKSKTYFKKTVFQSMVRFLAFLPFCVLKKYSSTLQLCF